MSDKPRILLFTGEGKGKTTAALGMVLRAVGHGMTVGVFQFIKAGPTGELDAATRLPGVEIQQVGRGFVPDAADPGFAGHKAAAEAGLRQAREAIESRTFGLIVLDEICLAVSQGLLAESDVVEAVGQASPEAVVVLTGRGATKGLIALADTVTEMRCIRHALRAGVPAQKGVER